MSLSNHPRSRALTALGLLLGLWLVFGGAALSAHAHLAASAGDCEHSQGSAPTDRPSPSDTEGSPHHCALCHAATAFVAETPICIAEISPAFTRWISPDQVESAPSLSPLAAAPSRGPPAHTS